MTQQPPPPQFSPDGLFWWDGIKWVPRPGVPAVTPQPPPSGYYSAVPPPPPPPRRRPGVSQYWYTKPSPGLRIALIVFLALEVVISGLLSLVFLIAAAGGGQDLLSYGLGFFVLLTFTVSGIALVAELTRATWSHWMAIAAGVLMGWWVVGAIIGLPVLVCAGRLEFASHQGGGSRQY